MKRRHTPGPWTRSGQTVISQHPIEGHRVKGCDDTFHYGGYLIAESVAQENLALIAAAPELLLACQGALNALMLKPYVSQEIAIEYLKEVIGKAEGEKIP